jgi:hypothetical protein
MVKQLNLLFPISICDVPQSVKNHASNEDHEFKFYIPSYLDMLKKGGAMGNDNNRESFNICRDNKSL